MVAWISITVKVTVPLFYHSNVRRGSGVVGRSWREFCSLVRRVTPGLSIGLCSFGLVCCRHDAPEVCGDCRWNCSGKASIFEFRDDIKMTIVLDSAFAKPEDVGKVLGVPKARVKWLKRLAGSQTIFSGKIAEKKNGAGASASAKKRNHARGKAKKATR
jgi:hypothetical protein